MLTCLLLYRQVQKISSSALNTEMFAKCCWVVNKKLV